ncbi:pyruvate kinase [Cytobacillus sp. NCCP-133]|uniref:pyruvate kinase n=1 Tax=Cytobacillus sp. NCCP-133 TaxID=766848 RepID=UPI00222E908A|nr:pyruvate kinase [Cytobacillus sp. NCCP-133]GLB60962.1 hypothetical protein NCCP133_30940 [Cytobacillus sp. NCCP-133]
MLITKKLCYSEKIPKSLFSMVELLNGGMDFAILRPSSEHYMGLEKRMASLEEASRISGRRLNMILELSPSIPKDDDSDQRLMIREDVKAEIKWGKKVGISYYYCPNIRNRADVLEYKKEILKAYSKDECLPMILSELGNAYSIKNIIEIVKESDALIVNTNSLERQFPSKQVPLIINDIILKCNENGKPVILKEYWEDIDLERINYEAVDGIIFVLEKNSRKTISEVIEIFNRDSARSNGKTLKTNPSVSLSNWSHGVHLANQLNARAIIITIENNEGAILTILKANS